MPWFRINGSPEIIRRAKRVFQTAGRKILEEGDGTFFAFVSRRNLSFIPRMTRKFGGIRCQQVPTYEDQTFDQRWWAQTHKVEGTTMLSTAQATARLDALRHQTNVRYAIWSYRGHRKRLRHCRRGIMNAGRLTCADAPVAGCFYVFVPSYEDLSSVERQLERQVSTHHLGGYLLVPDGADLSALIAEAKTQVSEEKRRDQAMVLKTDDQGEGGLTEAYEEATEILHRAQAEAVQTDGEVTQVPAEEISITLRSGQTVTLKDIQELAGKGSKGEAVRALKVATGTFYKQILGGIPGAKQIAFSYFCRVPSCPEVGKLFGKGDEGQKQLKHHAGRVHRRLKHRVQVETLVQVSLAEIPDEDLLAALEHRASLREGEVQRLIQEMEVAKTEAVARVEAEYTPGIREAEKRRDNFNTLARRLRGD